MDDTRLIRRAAAGHRREAGLLVDAYYSEILGFCCHQLHTREDAQDVTQEIFIAMLRGLSGYDKRKAGFRTWLYRIAANKIIDFKRRLARPYVPLEALELAAPEDLERRAEAGELAETVDALLRGEPEEAQRIFRLHVYGGLTFAEAAAALDMNEATVKTKYYRLIAKIRRSL